MRSPTAVEPVNEIMSTSGESTSASPTAGLSPQTKFSTPGGSTPSTMWQSAATPSGSTGAGFTTTVLPHASAGAIFPAQFVIGKFDGVMQATTPMGSRAAMPNAIPPGPSRGPTGVSGGCVASSAYLRNRTGTAPTCCDSATGRTAPVSAMVRSTRPGRRVAKPCRGVTQPRAALGRRHARPRAVLEGLACRAGGLERLRRRRLGRPAGDLLGGRIDHRIRPAGGGNPPAADQDLADKRLRHALRRPGYRYAARAASAASRCRVVLWIGSRSKRGSTWRPNVSIERRTYFWSSVSVSGA